MSDGPGCSEGGGAMALQGNLQDMSVAGLIPHHCQGGRTARTIQRSYAGLLLEGMRRIDEATAEVDAPQAAGSPAAGKAGRGSGKEEGTMSERLLGLKAIEGVTGVVIAARDGVVLEHALDGDPEIGRAHV